MIEWGLVRVAQVLLGTDNAFSAVERGDRVFVPVIFPVIFASSSIRCYDS